MRELPRPEVYEQEFHHFPWGALIDRVLNTITDHAPKGGTLLDLMCGPGYLLGKIHERRPDLLLRGVDIDEDFVRHAQAQHPYAEFEQADCRTWQSKERHDVVVCTAGTHHIPYDDQPTFLRRIPSFTKPAGLCILADPYIDDYATEAERQLAAARLGYEYLLATLKTSPPPEIIAAAIDIMHNDVLGHEWKTSIKQARPLLEDIFTDVQIHKTWPDHKSEHGDYYLIARAKV